MSEDINQEILVELRKIRTISRRMCYLIGVFIAICIVIPFFRGGQRQDSYSWPQVRTTLEHGDSQKALSMAKWLVDRQPDYAYGHAYLGYVYLARGELGSAESEYLRAYQLFPDEDAQKDSAAASRQMAFPSRNRLWSTTPRRCAGRMPNTQKSRCRRWKIPNGAQTPRIRLDLRSTIG
jgi:tetratricopeptide (TPR) repeat protein